MSASLVFRLTQLSEAFCKALLKRDIAAEGSEDRKDRPGQVCFIPGLDETEAFADDGFQFCGLRFAEYRTQVGGSEPLGIDFQGGNS